MADIERFTKAPPVTADQVEKARQNKIEAAKHGLLITLAPAAGVVALAPVVPAWLKTATTVFSGVHFHKMPGGTVKAGITPFSAALFLAPIPAGVVPPEVYGIDPSIVPHSVGEFPGQKTLGFKADEVREQVFNAREREVQILAYLRRGAGGQALGDVSTERLVADLAFLRTTALQEANSVNARDILERRVPERLAHDASVIESRRHLWTAVDLVDATERAQAERERVAAASQTATQRALVRTAANLALGALQFLQAQAPPDP